MNPDVLPAGVRDQLDKKVENFERKHGTEVSQIAQSLVSVRSDAWEEISTFVLLKHSLGIPLANGERLIVAARGLLLNQQSGGLESFIESEECDFWKYLLEFLLVDDVDSAAHFDKLMNLGGGEFSQDRDARLNQLADYLDNGGSEELSRLEESYCQAPYPIPERVVAYVKQLG